MQRHSGAMGPMQGELLRDEGIRAAEAHADSVAPDWAERASWYLRVATDGRPIDRDCPNWPRLSRFQTTDFRKWAEARGLPKPPDPRAYGGVMRRAAKAGLIIADGYAQKPDASAHACPAVVWRVAR